MEIDLNEVEKGFNIAGSIPIVGVVSGAVRVVASVVQMAAGVVLAGIGLLHAAVNGFKSDVFASGRKHFSHGGLNLGRGCIEMCLATSFLALVWFGVQALSPIKFQPIFRY